MHSVTNNLYPSIESPSLETTLGKKLEQRVNHLLQKLQGEKVRFGSFDPIVVEQNRGHRKIQKIVSLLIDVMEDQSPFSREQYINALVRRTLALYATVPGKKLPPSEQVELSLRYHFFQTLWQKESQKIWAPL